MKRSPIIDATFAGPAPAERTVSLRAMIMCIITPDPRERMRAP